MKQFVTFEGIDGSGKTTVAKLVYEKIESEGKKVVFTYEPTDSWIGRCVQNCIETDCDPFITAFTFIADRIEHCKQIKKWLDSGNIVICDRYADSTYAYQEVQLRDKIDDPIRWLKELSKDKILDPDRIFIFDVDPEISLKRIQKREKLIPFEKVSFLKKVRKNYLDLIDGPSYIKLDASSSIDELVDICYNDIIS